MQLENSAIALTFDRHTGGFASIKDKRTGHEYVGAPERALLFRLIAPEGEMAGAPVDAANASIEVKDTTAVLTYHLDGIEAIATVALEAEGAFTAQLRVTNNGPRVIEEVMFPYVRGLAPLPEAKVIWPFGFFRQIEDVFGKGFGQDHITWNQWTQKHLARYPEHLASAWCDYGNAAQGIGIEGRHTDFSMMDFFLHKCVEKTLDPVRRSLDMVTVQPRRIKPGETWESAPVRVSVHSGDWHATAKTHREWLETWNRKPDRPKRFAEAIGWHFYFMKHQDGLVVHTYDDLPRMAEASLAAGCPYLLLFGWQQCGHDNAYLYGYYANEDWGGAANLRKNIERCRELGVEVIPFFNGTLANIEAPEHKEFGHRWEAKTRAGHPYYAGDWARQNFDASSRNRAMLHHEMAPCEEHRAYYMQTITRMIDQYGFRNMQLDQGSEKLLVDYDESHVTTTPDRVYVDGLLELLPAVRETVQRANPDGVVISEFLNDFTGQWCDSSWDWTLMMPLPEPILYTLPWVYASHEIDALEYDQVNVAFAYKMHLDMKIDGGDAPITNYPKFADHVRRNAELRRRVAAYYCYADFRDQDGIQAEGEKVLAKVYQAASGKTGIVLAETGGAKATVKLRSDWKPASGGIRTDSNREVTGEIQWAEEMVFDLEPYEVRVLCIDAN